MNWTMFSTKVYKATAADSKCGSSFCYTRKPRQKVIHDTQRGSLLATSWPQDGVGAATVAKDFRDFEQRFFVARNVIWRFKGNSMWSKQNPVSLSRQFGHKAGTGRDPDLNRDFLVQLWVADRKMENSKRKRRGKAVKYSKQTPYHYSSYGWYPDTFANAADPFGQPPLSQSISGFLKPESPEEVNFCLLLSFSTLRISALRFIHGAAITLFSMLIRVYVL